MNMMNCRPIHTNHAETGQRQMAVRHVAVSVPGCVSASLAVLGLLALVACVTPSAREPASPTEQQLVGKTRSQILTCAGPPKREMAGERGANFTYYREASLLERRAVQSKGSLALSHPICRADLYLEDDRVTEVQFTTLPPSSGSYDLCEAIFERCENQ